MDIRSIREDMLGMTQAQFAEFLGIDQSTVSRIEKSNEVSFNLVALLSQKTGKNIEELTNFKKATVKPLDIRNSWSKAVFTKQTLIEYIKACINKLTLSEQEHQSYIDELKEEINNQLKKPHVVMMGKSDAGKTTMVNSILGTNALPTDYTRVTSVATYIKHISDKPDYTNESVWVFRTGDENEQWDETRLYDEAYCKSWKLASGSLEALYDYGTRQGRRYNENAGAAVVFLDSPVLLNCDIIDLPGFGTGRTEDDLLTNKAAIGAEVIVYLASAKGFLNSGVDYSFLNSHLTELKPWEKAGENDLPPLANFFIVATSAGDIYSGNPFELKKILDTNCKDLRATHTPEFWTAREKATGYDLGSNESKALRNRFFTYETNIPDLCAEFRSQFQLVTEALPGIIDAQARSFLTNYCKRKKLNIEHEIAELEDIIDDRNKYHDLLEEIDATKTERDFSNSEMKKSVRDDIEKLNRESVVEYTKYFNSTINIDSIVSLMQIRDVSNKQNEVDAFVSYLQGSLHEECAKILSQKSDKFAIGIGKYISSFEAGITTIFGKHKTKADFNAEWQFASILSKIGIIGGLGAFLLSAGFGVTLGLSSLILGGAGIFAAVVRFLGPIGLTVGLLLSAILGVITLFGGGWRKSVAKKIVKSMEDEKVLEKYNSGIHDYWNTTETAFEQAARKLEEELEAYVENLRDIVNSSDINEIKKKIASLRDLHDFFSNIPL